jgi:quercetin dioxygenase-like cupin family protein
MVCHFSMKKGAKIPFHNHPAAQNGYMVSGRLRFSKKDGSTFVAEAGCGYAFAPDEHHAAEVLDDSEVIECFAPMRAEYA